MTALRSQARELLDAARLEHTPSAADRAHVIRALLDAAAQTAAQSAQPTPLAKRLPTRAKVLLLAALVLLIASAMYVASQLGQR